MGSDDQLYLFNSKACEKDAATVSKEDYVVGQVANSLFQNKPTARGTGSLVQLFSAPETEIQPVYVAVPRVSTFLYLCNSQNVSSVPSTEICQHLECLTSLK